MRQVELGQSVPDENYDCYEESSSMMSSFFVHPQNSFLVLENPLIFGALGALWVFLRTSRSLTRGVVIALSFF